MSRCILSDFVLQKHGRMAFELNNVFDGKAWLCRISALYYGCVHGWKRPTAECLEPLTIAHEVGIESGDIEFAMLGANVFLWNQFESTPIPKLIEHIERFTKRMRFYGQHGSITVREGTISSF